MQQVGRTKESKTEQRTENLFFQQLTNRMIYNPTENHKNEINISTFNQVVYVNAEFPNRYRVALTQTEATGSSQKKKNRHVHFAEPLVTYQYIDQHCGAKQTHDTELIGVRKLVKALPNDSDKSEAAIQQKRALLKRLEDLGEAVEWSQKVYEAELEAEREKNRLLKQKLRKRKVSHSKECLRFKAELLDAKAQADVLQQKVLLQEELELELANAKRLSQSLQGQLDVEIHLKNTLIMHFKELAAIVSCSPQHSTELPMGDEEQQVHLKVLCKRNCQRYEAEPGGAQQQDVLHGQQQAPWPNDPQEDPQTRSSEADQDISEEVCFPRQGCQQAEAMTQDAHFLWSAIWHIVGWWKSQK